MKSGIKLAWASTFVVLLSFSHDVSAQKSKWVNLFDGKTLNGWHSYLQDEPLAQWQIQDGAIYLSEGGGRDLVTDAEFQNFELEMDWKIAEGGNSGIIYLVHEDPQYTATYRTGLEMQVLDNWRHPDAKMGVNGNRTAGSLYDMIPPSDTTAAKPAGQWNKVRLVVNNGKVEHYMNGKKIVGFSIVGPEWEKMVGESKFKDWEGFGGFSKGHIALQDHGNKVWFRNIRVREL